MPNGGAEASVRTYCFGPFRLIPERQLLLRGDVPVPIGGRARDILTALLDRAGDVVDKRELIARVWPDTHVAESNLKVNMNALRRALGECPDAPSSIETVVGRGYRFAAEVVVSQASEPASATGPLAHHGNLPNATTRIVGRTEAIEAIQRELSEARLVSIVGPGGAGKTTVALAAAELLIERFRDGVWWVDLARLNEPSLVPDAVAAAVGLATHASDRLAALESYLREREVLLVFDNCEHLIDAASASAQRLLAGTTAVSLLATSREPLRLPGERVRRLSGLESPPAGAELSATAAAAFPAVRLFAERASDRLETFRLNDDEAAAAAEICRRLDGLPLAIELAATRVDALGVRALSQHLDARLGRSRQLRGGHERHRTLQAMIDWSYRLLPDGEKLLLRRLSVFAGSFDPEAACELADGDVAERARTLDDIAHLVEKSLLATEVRGESIAYRLLETTRAYCLEQLRASGEEDAIRRRHADHVCAVLEGASADWVERPSREWAQRYGGFLDDLRNALDWLEAADADRSLLIRLTVAGCFLWNHFSLTEECRIRVTRALEDLAPAGGAGTPVEMRLQMSLAGATMFTRGAIPAALTALERVHDIAVRVGDLDHQLRCLRMMSSYELFLGNPDGKARSLTTFLRLAGAADPTALSAGDTHMALAELFLGRLDTSRQRLLRHYRRTLKDSNDPRFARFLYDQNVDIGNVLSHVEWLRGCPDTARQITRETVELARRTEHELSLSNALAWACMTYLLSGDYRECGECAASLEEQVVRHGIVIWRPVATFCRGAVAHARGATDAGIATLEQALAEFREIRHLARMPFYLGVFAEALARSGRLADAEHTVRAALERVQLQKEHWILPEILRIQASILSEQGRRGEAEQALLEAVARAGELRSLSLQLRAAIDLADGWRAQSREADARRMLAPICAAFGEGFTTRDLIRAHALLGQLDEPAKPECRSESVAR